MCKWLLQWVGCCGLTALFLVVSSSFGFCQVIVTSGTTTSVTATEFWTEQSTLDQQLYQLVAEGSTSDQLSDWMDENQAAIQSQQTLAVQLGAQSAALSFPYVTTVTIPSSASQDEADFLTAQANLENYLAQIHNQLLSQGVVSGDTEMAQFQAQCGSAIQAQQQLAQTISAEENARPQPVSPPPVIPAGCSATLQSFLALQYQLLCGQIAVQNQNVSSTAAQLDAALLQWQQANAASFQQLNQLAQSLTPSTSTTTQQGTNETPAN